MTPASRSPGRLRTRYAGSHRDMGTARPSVALRPPRLRVDVSNRAAPSSPHPVTTGRPTLRTPTKSGARPVSSGLDTRHRRAGGSQLADRSDGSSPSGRAAPAPRRGERRDTSVVGPRHVHPINPPTTAHPERSDRPSFGAIAVNVGSTKRAQRRSSNVPRTPPSSTEPAFGGGDETAGARRRPDTERVAGTAPNVHRAGGAAPALHLTVPAVRRPVHHAACALSTRAIQFIVEP